MKFKFQVSSSSEPRATRPYSFLNQLFACWTLGIAKKRFEKKSSLDSNDLPSILESYSSQKLGDSLESDWLHQCKENEKPSLLKVLLKNFGLKFLIINIGVALDELFFRNSQLLCLKWLIQSFDFPDFQSRYLYAGGLCLFTFLHAYSYQWLLLHVSYLGMRIRIGISSLIYRKTLRLNSVASSSKSTNVEGQGINLLSNESSRFDLCLFNAAHVFVGPISFVILVYLLYAEVGLIPAFSGVGCLLACLPIQCGIGTLSKRYRTELSKRIDSRSNLMAQIVSGFKIIKLYGWEHLFASRIEALRKKELSSVWKTKLVLSFLMSLGFILPKLATAVTLTVYFLLGNPLLSNKVFFISAMFMAMRQTVAVFIPLAISELSELWAVVLKVQDYLKLHEKVNEPESPPSNSTNCDSSEPELILQNVNVSYAPEKFALSDLNLDLKGNKLVMIVGAVGSGKSTLLHTIMNECKPISGTLASSSCQFSYASQTPWMFSGTVKENIILATHPENILKLEQIILACGLTEDLLSMGEGLETSVGPKGSSLSGGQKARISLARTLYHSEPGKIVLLDDPLASIDSKVGKHIFQHVILDYLKSNMRLLVTHQLQNLAYADWIVVLEKGKVSFQGSFDNLQQSGIELSKIVEKGASSENTICQLEKVEAREHDQEIDLPIPKKQKLLLDKIPSKKSQNNQENTYLRYYKLGNSTISIVALVFITIVPQLIYSYFDVFVAEWSAEFNVETHHYNNETYEYGLVGIVAALIITMIVRALWMFKASLKVGKELHDQMLCGFIRAPITFYNQNNPGEILNRFTKDLGEVDFDLSTFLALTIQNTLILFGVVFVVITSNYILAIPSLVFLCLIFTLRYYFVIVSKDLKSLEANAKGPLYTHFSDSFQGIITIRVTNSVKNFVNQFDELQDTHSKSWIAYVSICRWFGMWIEIFSSVFLLVITVALFCLNNEDSSSQVWIGLAISSILSLLGIVQYGIRMATEVDNTMKSFDRCLEYTNLPPEAPLSTGTVNPPENWPTAGTIQFSNVSVFYGSKMETPALNNLNFSIKDGEKIGIVGRTGAGKSSLIVALFRLIEPIGKITVDGIDISQIGLHCLRNRISIIPQDPVLFPGSVRYNLDPFGNYKDFELWKSLGEVELLYKISSLDDFVAEGGCNFSVGEKQLICLARTILRKNKILIMDESTANVDTRTESMIQNALDTKFPDCTIISIAHRLSTVMNCDRIMALDHGEIMEFDSPENLLSSPSSYFKELVQTSQNDKFE